MKQCAQGHELSQYGNQRRCLICLKEYWRTTGSELRKQRNERRRNKANDSQVVRYQDTGKYYPGQHRDALDEPGVVIRVWRIGGAT
jgi:hypothetical protein